MHYYKEIKEKLIVSGTNTVIIPLRKKNKPRTAAACFITPESHHHPSCHPVLPDNLQIDLVELPHQWGVRIGWRVRHPREIEWIVIVKE